MPRDLFDTVVVRPPSVRSRRSPVVVASIAGHLVAVVAMRYVRRRVGIGGLEARWTGSAEGFAALTRVIGR